MCLHPSQRQLVLEHVLTEHPLGGIAAFVLKEAFPVGLLKMVVPLELVEDAYLAQFLVHRVEHRGEVAFFLGLVFDLKTGVGQTLTPPVERLSFQVSKEFKVVQVPVLFGGCQLQESKEV
jgi:hypothetical protein